MIAWVFNILSSVFSFSLLCASSLISGLVFLPLSSAPLAAWSTKTHADLIPELTCAPWAALITDIPGVEICFQFLSFLGSLVRLSRATQATWWLKNSSKHKGQWFPWRPGAFCHRCRAKITSIRSDWTSWTYQVTIILTKKLEVVYKKSIMYWSSIS